MASAAALPVEVGDGGPRLRNPVVSRAAAAAGVGLLTTLTALAQLFLGGRVGLADNGDAARLMCTLGLVIAEGSTPANFVWRYDDVRPCPSGGFYEYRSSWWPVVAATVRVWQAVTGDTGFDVGALAVVSAVLLGAAVATFFLALPEPPRQRLLLCGLVVVVVCDIGFVSYLQSGYGDAPGFIGFVFLCAGLVGVVTRRSLPWLVVMALSVVFLGTAKTQLATAVVAAAVALLFSRRHWGRDQATSPPVRRRIRRTGLAVTAVLLAATLLSGYVARGQGEGFSRGNKFDVLFYTILADSPDPAADLRDMGLPPYLARFAGQGGWDVDTPYGDPVVVANSDRIYSWATYVEFLATHPDRLVTMARRSFDAVLDARVDYLSNVATEPGSGPVLSDRPSPVFWSFDRAPRGWPVPVLLLVWSAGAGLGLRWARSPDARRAARGVLLLASATFASSQSLGALSDGYYELARHNIHAAFGTALLLTLLVEWGLTGAWTRWARRGGHRSADAPRPPEGSGSPPRDPDTEGAAR